MVRDGSRREALCVAAGQVVQTWDMDGCAGPMVTPAVTRAGDRSQGRPTPSLGKAPPLIYRANLRFGDSDSLCSPGWF